MINKEPSLKRTLGLFTSTLLVVGLMIGSGVFKKIVPIAQTGLGENGILMAWLFAGIISLLGAFSISGLASLTEESGGIYEYLQLSFGKFIAFLYGWACFTVIGSGAIASVSFLFAQTVNIIVPLPKFFESFSEVSIGTFIYPFADSGIKLVGIGAIIILTAINCLGTKESGVINNMITSAKIAGILILIFFGLNYTPEVEIEGVTVASTKSYEGIQFISIFLTALLSAFWAYDGWYVVSYISGEIINPKRNVPLALTYGMSLVIGIYILANYYYMRVLPLDFFKTMGENEIGAVVVAETLLGNFGRILLLILIIISVFGCLNSNIVSVPRIYFRMAQEKYFFKSASSVHTKFKTPYMALIFSMLWSCVLLVSGSFDMLTDLVIFSSYLFFGLLAIALLRMKHNGTIKARFIGYPIIPLIFLVFCICLCTNTILVQPKQSLFGLMLILTGVPFYFYFKKTTKTNVG